MNEEMIVRPAAEISDAERLNQIAGEIATLFDTLNSLKVMMCSTAVSIGRLLTEAKSKVKHGEWTPYLEKLGLQARTAQNYMRLFDEFGADQVSLFGDTKTKTFSFLPVSKALALLDAPESSREALAEQAENLSVRQLKAEIEAEKERVKLAEKAQEEAQVAAQEAENRANGYKLNAQAKAETIERMKVEHERLEADLKKAQEQPKKLAVETVAVVDEDAVRKAVEDVQKTAQAAIEKQNEQARAIIDRQAEELNQMRLEADEAKAAARAAEVKAKAAEKLLQEAKSAGVDSTKDLQEQVEQLQRERDEAKEKAATADRNQSIIEINVVFKELQTDANHMKELLAKLDDITATKLKRAMKQVFKSII